MRAHTDTLAKLCFHPGVQFQPAAGKTSANYSLRAAFAAQHSMLFDTICLEFEVSFIEFGFFSILFVPPAFKGFYVENNDNILYVRPLW